MWWNTVDLENQEKELKHKLSNYSEEDQKLRREEEYEKSWSKIEECVLSFKAGKNILFEGGRFDTCSLGTWMNIVKASGISHYVPEYICGMINLEQCYQTNFAPIPLNITGEMLKLPGMVRADMCGSENLKLQRSYRGGINTDSQIIGARKSDKDNNWYFTFDDRIISMTMSYVGQLLPDGNIEIPIWWRPWVKAKQITIPRPKYMGGGEDSWPMEWRVIVQNGEVVAISNYYIQAPIIEYNDYVKDQLKSILFQMELILSFMKDKNIQPYHPRYLEDFSDSDDISFTCDFISRENGSPLFLEAGPKIPVDSNNVPVYEWGSHPCYFIDKKVTGIALSKNNIMSLDKVLYD